MKKLFLFLMLLLGTFTAHAEDFPYLTFEMTDGARVSVSTSSLTMSFSGTTLKAGDQSFTVSNLSKMYFSDHDESTGIETLYVSDWNEITDIYDLNGKKVTKDQIKDLLNTGVIKVMFCSDAASEGLNLQAARVLVNVDVPWTPARLEQRIGRVARLGQKASTVDIVNVWYPRSVEERMYTRIGQRLKDYSIAVGEFPEVVADTIRRSILDGDAIDDSTQQLQEIRNSLQTEALRALWNRGVCGETSSQSFRKRLLEDISARAEHGSDEVGMTTVWLQNGDIEKVTAEEGHKETISLSSRCVLEYHPSLCGYSTAKDRDGRYCAYAHGESVLNPEMLPDAFGGTTDFSSMESTDRPKWLPDAEAMDLRYVIEYESSAPRFWPPRLGEEE